MTDIGVQEEEREPSTAAIILVERPAVSQQTQTLPEDDHPPELPRESQPEILHQAMSQQQNGVVEGEEEQQQQKSEDELRRLRVQVKHLTDGMRDMQWREDMMKQQEEVLKREIRTLERGRSREGLNLEYLKNVLVKFMETRDKVCVCHVLHGWVGAASLPP